MGWLFCFVWVPLFGLGSGKNRLHHSCSHSGTFGAWGVNTVGMPRWWGRTSTVGRQRGALRGDTPRTREGRRPDRPKSEE